MSGQFLMSIPEEQRPDLASLRIQRDSDESTGVPIARIVVWVIAAAAVIAIAYATYMRVVVPRSAPVVETTIVKPSVNVANRALLTATGYLVASRTAKVTPKLSGKVVQLKVETGVDLHTIEVEADVNESNIAQLHEGQPAEVTVDAFPGKKWKGVLRQIIPTADRAKAVVKVKVAIVNPDARLLPEMAASVSFLQAERTSAELQEQPTIWPTLSTIVR